LLAATRQSVFEGRAPALLLTKEELEVLLFGHPSWSLLSLQHWTVQARELLASNTFPRAMVSGIRNDDGADSHPSSSSSSSSSRCWLPLVYSSMAILMDHRDQHDDIEATLSALSASAESMSTLTGGRGSSVGAASSLFPCHSWVLAAVVCELLLLDGTIDAATMAVQPNHHHHHRQQQQQQHLVRMVGSRFSDLVVPSVADDDNNDGEDNDNSGAACHADPIASTTTTTTTINSTTAAATFPRHEWHMMSHEDRARYAWWRGEGAEPPPSLALAEGGGGRGGARDDEGAGRPPKVRAAPRRKNKRQRRSENDNAGTAVASGPTHGTTSVGARSGREDEKATGVLPSAERVVAAILGRVSDYAASHPLAFPKGEPFPSATTFAAAASIRKVSDADSIGTRRIGSDIRANASPSPPSPPISASSYPMSVGRRDLARHWEGCRSLLRQRNQQRHLDDPSCQAATDANPPPLMEASIVTEEVLRKHANEMVRILLETFETQHLRRFFGYRKPSTRRKPAGEGAGGGVSAGDGGDAHENEDDNGSREGFVRLIMDFVFDASHAMFAWQDFEATAQPGTLPASPKRDDAGCSQKDRAIAAALFDDRALRQIGGMENGSIVRLALALGRGQRSRQSWADLLTSGEGKHLVEHHLGTPEKLYAVGEKRRGRRMRRNRASNPSLVPVDCSAMIPISSAPSHAPSLATTNASVEAGARSRASSIASLDDDVISPSLDSTHGRIRVRMSRKGPRWGVKLCKIGDMCVVERCGSFNSAQPGFLREGDNVLLVANPHGDSAYSPAYKSLSSCQHWFREIVKLFSENDEVFLVVQRVESICDASTSSASCSVGS
jgi:hypothetical protein